MATIAKALNSAGRGRAIAALVVAILVGYVIAASWAGNPVSLNSIVFFIIVGITLGSIYAVAATGLVVTYTTSGVFNFAQGAIGMIMAFVYWELKVDLGIQTLVAFLLTVLIAAPLLARHRGNANVQGFVKGAYAAAIGTILGACILLGRIAIGDWLTASIGIVSLVLLFRWKVSNPLLVATTAVVGLLAYPILQPGWVMVH